MVRQALRYQVLDSSGVPIAGASIQVAQLGTTTNITQTMYAGLTGGTTVANPLITDASGWAQAYFNGTDAVALLRVTVIPTLTGFTFTTRNVQLGSDYAVLDAGDAPITGTTVDANDRFNMARSVAGDPTSLVVGDMWYNTATNALHWEDNTGTQTVGSATGDITGVTAGDGLTGGGLTGDVTLNVGAGNAINVDANDVDVSVNAAATAVTTLAEGDKFLIADVDDTNITKSATVSQIAATMLDAGNNKVFYANTSGAITELPLGASGEVLTSQGATSAPNFSAIPASGGTKEMVASGAISGAGISVALNSDGTVSAVADARVSPAFGAYAAATSTSISITMTRVYGIYHAEEDKVVVFYPSNEYSGGGGNYRLYSAAASISGSTLTFGSSIQIDTDYGGWMIPYNMAIAYDPDTYKVWYMWHKDTQSGGYQGVVVATATVSGTTVTKTAYLDTGDYTSAAGTQDNSILTYDTTNNQMVACYSSYTGTGSATWFVVTESGGTITANTRLTSTTSYVVSGIGNMVWLPTVARMVCWGGRGINRHINTISVSGTTLSIDQQDIYTSNFGGDGQYGHENWIATTSDGTKVIAGGRDKTTSYTSAWNIYTITAGSATTGAYTDGQDMGLGAYQIQGASITRVGTTDTYVIQNQGDHKNYFATFELGALGTATPTLTVAGSGLTEDPEAGDLDGAVGTNCNDGWMGSTHNKVLTTSAWKNPTYIQAAATAITPASGATTAPAWFGISEAAISDTATGTITVTSGTNEGVSGLTTGETYFMQADGSLATTAASPDYGKVGPALSATSILIQGIGDTTVLSL